MEISCILVTVNDEGFNSVEIYRSVCEVLQLWVSYGSAHR